MLLHEPAGSFAEVLSRLAEIREQFRQDYQNVLRLVLDRGKPTAVCTVYDAVPGLNHVETTGLSLFNDVILREAFRAGLPVIEFGSGSVPFSAPGSVPFSALQGRPPPSTMKRKNE